MAHLITIYTTGNMDTITRLIDSKLFSPIYILTNKPTDFFVADPLVKIIPITVSVPIADLQETMYDSLKVAFSKDKILDLDIALNIASGTGKEHTALLSAVIKLGYGIRLIEVDESGNIIEM